MNKLNQGGIYLEQNKMPALGKEIRYLGDGVQQMEHLKLPKVEAPEYISPNEIIRYAQEANIIDESDGLLLYQKLRGAIQNSTNSLVIDIIDDEPYISSQLSVFLQYMKEVLSGIHLITRAIGAKSVELQIYEDAIPHNFKLPPSAKNMKVKKVKAIYPAEYFAQRSHSRKQGLTVGACAAFYLYRAIYHLERQSDCFVTVAGDCIASPGNYRVPLGMNITDILSGVGTIAEPKLLIAGGSMTGYAVTDPYNYKTSSTTRGILAFYTTYKDYGHVCIGCGRCTEVCPEGLSPYFIYQAMIHTNKKGIDICDADLCNSCGTCSYVCPAKLDLAQIVAACGDLIRKRGGK